MGNHALSVAFGARSIKCPSREFLRTPETVFGIVQDKAELSKKYSDLARDESGNGRYDYLAVTADVQASETGTLGLSAILTSSSGVFIASASTQEEIHSKGLHKLTLSFDGDVIFHSGLGGPYKVAQIRLFDDDSLLQLDEDDVGWLTAAYDHRDFGPVYLAYMPVTMSK